MKRKLSFEHARAHYPHRFTMDHVPHWALKQRQDGTYYAPQYASDREWYERTRFPGEEGHHGIARDCYSRTPSWPLGTALCEPYRVGMKAAA